MFNLYSIFENHTSFVGRGGILKVRKMQKHLFVIYIRHSSTRLKRTTMPADVINFARAVMHASKHDSWK